jgi:hypothetical protein
MLSVEPFIGVGLGMDPAVATAAHDASHTLSDWEGIPQPQPSSDGLGKVTGVAKPVLPMHIYNLCLGRSSKPALILDVRSPEDFNTSHLINSVNCHILSASPTAADVERGLLPSPAALLRFRNRENAIVAVVSTPSSTHS